ncbi:MAG TPA: hypothetical protein G4O01_00835 [Dehalococcoidia bacterium]|nr:hypothetical protein [Dehalococcoidia bacterium]
MLSSKIQVSVKYCGSCNPLIDLAKLGNALKEALSQDNDLTLVPPESARIDIMLILCGCPRACGNKEEIRARAARSIVVAGETVDLVPTPEKDISAAIMKKLKSG